MRNLTFITPTVVVVVAAVVRIDRVVVELGGFFGSEEGEKVFSIEKRDLAFHFHSLRSSRTAATVGKAFDAAQKQRRGTFSLVSSFAQALSFRVHRISERLSWCNILILYFFVASFVLSLRMFFAHENCLD
jgi:hypothetical protein